MKKINNKGAVPVDKNLPVKIADEGSSLKAYKALKAKLSENSISFIEAQ